MKDFKILEVLQFGFKGKSKISPENQKRAGVISAVLLVSVIAVVLVGQASANNSPEPIRPQALQWQLIGPAGGEEIMDIDVAPNDSRRLYAATQAGVYRSTNGGSSWASVLAGFFRELAIDPQQSNNIYTGPHGNSGYGVYKSTDGGDSWTCYDEGMTCSNLATLAVAASAPSILFTGSF